MYMCVRVVLCAGCYVMMMIVFDNGDICVCKRVHWSNLGLVDARATINSFN